VSGAVPGTPFSESEAGRDSTSFGEGSDPNDPDGQMNDQRMPTTDGQMASDISEEVIPPPADPQDDSLPSE
jgi:hypothetical protein